MREQAEALELGELGPHGRRRDGHARARDEVLRADRLAALDVLLDDASQDLPLALGQVVRRFNHLCAGILGEQLDRNGAAEAPSARRQDQGPRPSPSARRVARPSRSRRPSAAASTERLAPGERQRLVEPQAEHHAAPGRA